MTNEDVEKIVFSFLSSFHCAAKHCFSINQLGESITRTNEIVRLIKGIFQEDYKLCCSFIMLKAWWIWGSWWEDVPFCVKIRRPYDLGEPSFWPTTVALFFFPSQRYRIKRSPRYPPWFTRLANDNSHTTLLTRGNGADYSHPCTDREHPDRWWVVESFGRNRHKNNS